jgi:hypothetical protein
MPDFIASLADLIEQVDDLPARAERSFAKAGSIVSVFCRLEY